MASKQSSPDPTYHGKYLVRAPIDTSMEAMKYALAEVSIRPDGEDTLYVCNSLYTARRQFNRLHELKRWPRLRLTDEEGRVIYHNPRTPLQRAELREVYPTFDEIPD